MGCLYVPSYRLERSTAVRVPAPTATQTMPARRAADPCCSWLSGQHAAPFTDRSPTSRLDPEQGCEGGVVLLLRLNLRRATVMCQRRVRKTRQHASRGRTVGRGRRR